MIRVESFVHEAQVYPDDELVDTIRVYGLDEPTLRSLLERARFESADFLLLEAYANAKLCGPCHEEDS